MAGKTLSDLLKYALCVYVFQEATEGRGVDVIVEMLSNVNLSKDLQMLAYGGRVMVGLQFFFFYSTVVGSFTGLSVYYSSEMCC